MQINCVWEHNGDDTLLYAVDLIGAYARGSNLDLAVSKMEGGVCSYLKWLGKELPMHCSVKLVQEKTSNLAICDADSDVIFDAERCPLTQEEYERQKALALKSAHDFLTLYESIPDKNRSHLAARQTFYGQIPRTAEEMYLHTKNVNAYYFGEIGTDADNEGDILLCRIRGFEALESKSGFLANSVVEGSYGELWSLRKLLRRFIWHDRIHAKAMWRMATATFGVEYVQNPFCF